MSGYDPLPYQRPPHRAPNAPEPDPAWWLRTSRQSGCGRLWICAADRGQGSTRAILEAAVEKAESGQDCRVAVVAATPEWRRILANNPNHAPHLLYPDRWTYEPSSWRARSLATGVALDYLTEDTARGLVGRGHSYDLLVLDDVERFSERHLEEILSHARGAHVYASAADQLAPRTLDLLAWGLDLGMSVSLTRPGDRENRHLNRHVAEDLHRRIGEERRAAANRDRDPGEILYRGTW